MTDAAVIAIVVVLSTSIDCDYLVIASGTSPRPDQTEGAQLLFI